MSNNQPTWDFNLYDIGFPRHATDISTPARKAAVVFEASVRNDCVENGAFFRHDGAVILQKVGLSDRIPFSLSELNQATGSLFSHNHPDGLSFSAQDVQLAIAYRLVELRAVSPHWRHIMRPIASWPSPAAIIAAIRAETHRAHADVRAMMQSGQLSSRDCQWELQHQVWARISRSLKFEYRREAS